MKRKMKALLTVVLMLAMLAGCGNSSQTVASGGGKKAEALSECLSKEKVIAYEVDTVDKSETPDNIYFFEDGKVTVIPGKEFGLTMGDFAQMTDKEIWSTYETVRETYIEKYVSEKLESAKSGIESKIQSVEDNIESVTEQKEIFESALNGEVADVDFLGDVDFFELLDGYLYEFMSGWGEELTAEEEQQIWEAGRLDVLSEEKITAIRNSLDTCINKDTSEIAELQAKLEELTCATPFCDMSFSFVVKTDASGNNAQSESLVYPTLKYDAGGEAPDTLYDSLDFALGLTTEQQIYDTTYNCIALSGSGRFCTRETMETDTIDSKNVLVDLSGAEINELFKEEVMARYE